LGRRIPWARESVTRTGKKLELGLSFSYFGLERYSPGVSGPGESNGGGQGKRPVGGVGAKERGVPGGSRFFDDKNLSWTAITWNECMVVVKPTSASASCSFV
jgi:hypothetical protein